MAKFGIITTTQPGRDHFLYSTLSRAMLGTSGDVFYIQFYGREEELTDTLKTYLPQLAKRTGNTMRVNLLPQSLSVAHSKHWNVYHKHAAYFNLDDDLILTERSIKRLHESFDIWSAALADPEVAEMWNIDPDTPRVWVLPVIDVVNARHYLDYDDQVWPDYNSFIETTGNESSLKHRIIEAESVIVTRKPQVTSLWCLPNYLFFDSRIWDPIKEEFSLKGKRGYDIALEALLERIGAQTELMCGNTALHVGIGEPLIFSYWHSISKSELVQERIFNVSESQDGKSC